MAKPTYKVPTSLDMSMLDHELASVRIWDVAVPSFPVKKMLYWFGAFIIGMFMVTRSWIADAGVFFIVVFIIWYMVAAVYFGAQLKTGEMKFKQIMPLIEYLPHRNRRLLTRRTSAPSGFMSLVGIRDVSDDGVILFLDGSVARVYSVVGSASLLLFDADRDAIVDRVDNFWRKVGVGAEWITMTVHEPQQVYRQVAATERMNRALRVRDPDLEALLDERYSVLADEVGGQYRSVHQYMMVKAASMENLDVAHTVLHAEAEGSSLMFRSVTRLDTADSVLPVLQKVYRPQPTSMRESS